MEYLSKIPATLSPTGSVVKSLRCFASSMTVGILNLIFLTGSSSPPECDNPLWIILKYTLRIDGAKRWISEGFRLQLKAMAGAV